MNCKLLCMWTRFWYLHIALSLLFSFPVRAQVALEGTVVDAGTGEAVSGVNIEVVGTDRGAISDHEGKFSLVVSGDFPQRLRISHIGYMHREVEVPGPMPLKIRLISKVLPGEEITVVGKRTRSQAEASTAMDVIDMEAVQLQGSRDVGSALRRLSSVIVNESRSGSQTVSIRGSNPNEVAVYLDGVKINSAHTGVADLSQLDFYSLEHIEVLRGGNAFLFGQGNLGGVLNLKSRGAEQNALGAVWGEGLSFDDDLDLSVTGSGVLGPVGLGGRFSGRSRAYEGRTLTSSAFSHLTGDLDMDWGDLKARWYRLRNALTFPSGQVALGDNQMISSLRYRGSLAGHPGWDVLVGTRNWSESNSFFDNLDESLRDRNLLYRVDKEFLIKSLDAMVQLEHEDQSFLGDRTVLDFGSNQTTRHNTDIVRNTQAVAAVTRWISKGQDPLLRRLQVELSGRLDRIRTETSDREETYHGTEDASEGDPMGVQDRREAGSIQFMNRRIGLRMEGLTGRFRYSLFFSQGTNRRLPTLNDLFVKATTSRDSLRLLPLVSESFNSTEINGEISFTEFLTTPHISELSLKGAFFWNNYDNKIGYLEVKGVEELREPPVAYNEPEADIRGFEAVVVASFFDHSLRLQMAYTLLDIENPFIFPNRPGFRKVATADVDLGWFVVTYDRFEEGEQFVMGASVGRLLEPRENANLSMTLKRKWHGVDLRLTYTIRNLMSSKERVNPSDPDILFFNYYQQYRQLMTLGVNL
ncbi:MAG: TonB-dependent receptor plug domain-containing protein [Fidelibacterota bacterium]